MAEIDLIPVVEHYLSIRPKGAQMIVPIGAMPMKIYWLFPATDEATLILYDPLTGKEVGRENVPGAEARSVLAPSLGSEEKKN